MISVPFAEPRKNPFLIFWSCIEASCFWQDFMKWLAENQIILKSNIFTPDITIGHLQDPVTWYGINYTGTQMTQWDFQNKGKSSWTGKSSFVLKIPLRHLRPSVIYSVPCDRILQRAYWPEVGHSIQHKAVLLLPCCHILHMILQNKASTP